MHDMLKTVEPKLEGFNLAACGLFRGFSSPLYFSTCIPLFRISPKLEILGLYFSLPGFRCSVRVHRPTAKGLPLHSGGVSSDHFPSQPEAVQHSQQDAEYNLINSHDWQCSLALTQCSQLGLSYSTTGKFMWLPVVSNPEQNKHSVGWCHHLHHAGTCHAGLCTTFKAPQSPRNKVLCEQRRSLLQWINVPCPLKVLGFLAFPQDPLCSARHIGASWQGCPHLPIGCCRHSSCWLLCLPPSPQAAICLQPHRPAAGSH